MTLIYLIFRSPAISPLSFILQFAIFFFNDCFRLGNDPELECHMSVSEASIIQLEAYRRSEPIPSDARTSPDRGPTPRELHAEVQDRIRLRERSRQLAEDMQS